MNNDFFYILRYLNLTENEEGWIFLTNLIGYCINNLKVDSFSLVLKYHKNYFLLYVFLL
jgi:hypothetical protein